MDKLNIVRDCFWTMPSGSSYITDENGQLSSYEHGLYKSLNLNDLEYIEFHGSGNYVGRLESNNRDVELIQIYMRASGDSTVSINNVPMAVFSHPYISDQTGYVQLNNTQKQAILEGRIDANYDYFEVNFNDSAYLYNLEISYSGDNTWDNHTSSLPNVLSSYYTPSRLSFNGTSWINSSGNPLKYNEVDYVNKSSYASGDSYYYSVSNVDNLYIEQTSTKDNDSYWNNGQEMPNGGLGLVFDLGATRDIDTYKIIDSVSGYHAVWVSGSPVFSNDVPESIDNGMSAVFDGTILGNAGNILNTRLNDRSYLALIKTSTYDAQYRAIVSKGNITSEPGRHNFRVRYGTIGAYYEGISPTIGSIRVDDNNWHLIGVTYDRDGDLVIYVDGVQDLASVMPAPADGNLTKPLLIGHYDITGRPFIGNIAQIVAYNRVIPSSDVYAISQGSGLPTDKIADWNFTYKNSELDPISQITRARLNLRMSLPPSGVENARDSFEVNLYNSRYKNNDYKEEMLDAIGSIQPLDNKYGYFAYGAGNTVEYSGFRNYGVELNFIDPLLPSGNLSSTKHRNIDIFNNAELQLIGLPSGVQISSTELYLEYIPNNFTTLYTLGSVSRCIASGYPDYTTINNDIFGNGAWHHRGNLNESNTFSAFYRFNEGSGSRLNPTTTAFSGVYGDFRNSSNIITVPTWKNYYRNPVVPSGNTSVTCYQNMVYNTDNYINVDFNDRIELGSDFSLYFMLYIDKDNPPINNARFFRRGYAGDVNDNNFEMQGWVLQNDENVDVFFAIRNIYGYPVVLNTSNYNYGEPILVWVTGRYDGTNSIFKLSTHSLPKYYYAIDWTSHTLTTYGPRRQLSGVTTKLGSQSSYNQLSKVGLIEFGWLNSYLAQESTTDTDYATSTNNFKEFFATRVANAKYLANGNTDYVRWNVNVGSGEASWSTPYIIDDIIENKYELLNPVTTAGTNYVSGSGNFVIEMDVDHITNHPSGVDITVDIEFDSGATDNWKVLRSEFNVPSGSYSEKHYFTKHINMGEKPILVSDISSSDVKIKTKYVNIGSQTYHGEVKINSVKVYIESTCVAATGLDDLDLYTIGSAATTTDSLDLFITGDQTSSESVDLFVEGTPSVASGDTLTLFTDGLYYTINRPDFLLYIEGLQPDTLNSGVNLLTYGSNDNAVYKSMTLFVETDGLYEPQNMLPLYIKSDDNDETSDILNLFVKNDPWTDVTNELTLVTFGPSGIKGISDHNGVLTLDDDYYLDLGFNETSPLLFPYDENVLYFYIRGYGETDGALWKKSEMPLFIARDSESTTHSLPLFICQKQNTNTVDAIIAGHMVAPSSINLYIKGSGEPHNTLKLYTHGY